MKKLLFCVTTLLCVLFFSSCRNSESNQLLSAIPEDADLVLVGNIKTIVESADGSVVDGKLKLPTEITEIITENNANALDDINDLVKNSGIKLDYFAMTLVDNYNQPVFVVVVDDTNKFVGYIEDNDFREKDTEKGVKYFAYCTYESSYDPAYNRYTYIALNGNIAYIIPDVRKNGDFKPVKAIGRMIDDADNKSFADNKLSSYLSEGNAGAFVMKMPKEVRQQMRQNGLPSSMVDFYEGYLCAKCDLSNDKAQMQFKFVNEDGSKKDIQQFSKYFNINAKISSKALKYLNQNESLVLALALDDVKWDEYIDMIGEMANMPRAQRTQLSMIASYLSKIDGTLAFGLGLVNGLESAFALNYGRDVLDNIAFTAVVETADGKAKSLMNDLKGLMDNVRIPYDDTANGFTVTIPGTGSVYADVCDNFIVISSAPVKEYNDNVAVRSTDFTDYMMCMAACLNRDNKLMRDLRLDYDVSADITGDTNECACNVTFKLVGGDNKGLIAKVVNLVNTLVSQEGRINDMQRQYRNNY